MAIVWREHSAVEREVNLPAGWRFDPTEVELIQFYLSKIVGCKPLQANVMKEIDAHHFYQHHPQDLVHDSMRLFDEYFLVHGDEYFHGIINNMKLIGEGDVGSWRSLGNEEEIVDRDGSVIAFKIHYNFFYPESKGTNWTMELYRMPVPKNKEASGRQEWVVARIGGAEEC